MKQAVLATITAALLFSQAALAGEPAHTRSGRDPAQSALDPVAAQKKHGDSLTNLIDLADSSEVITVDGIGRDNKPETEAKN